MWKVLAEAEAATLSSTQAVILPRGKCSPAMHPTHSVIPRKTQGPREACLLHAHLLAPWGSFLLCKPSPWGLWWSHSPSGPSSEEICARAQGTQLLPQPAEWFAVWSQQSLVPSGQWLGSGHMGSRVWSAGVLQLGAGTPFRQEQHGGKGHSSHLKVGPFLKIQILSSVAFLKLKIKV